jgi:hypothetical protein
VKINSLRRRKRTRPSDSVDAKLTAVVNEVVLVLEVKRAVRGEARVETDRDLQYELEAVKR